MNRYDQLLNKEPPPPEPKPQPRPGRKASDLEWEQEYRARPDPSPGVAGIQNLRAGINQVTGGSLYQGFTGATIVGYTGYQGSTGVVGLGPTGIQEFNNPSNAFVVVPRPESAPQSQPNTEVDIPDYEPQVVARFNPDPAQALQTSLAAEGIQEPTERGPTSRVMLIQGPNGYRTMIDVARLPYTLSTNGQFTINLPRSVATALIADFAAAFQRLGLHRYQ